MCILKGSSPRNDVKKRYVYDRRKLPKSQVFLATCPITCGRAPITGGHSLFSKFKPGRIELESFQSQTHGDAEQKSYPVFPVNAQSRFYFSPQPPTGRVAQMIKLMGSHERLNPSWQIISHVGRLRARISLSEGREQRPFINKLHFHAPFHAPTDC